MSVDISRHSFAPRRGYSGVLMAQGRVQLDADWNEWLAILDRRRRTGTADGLGEASVSPLTPDAFRIEVSGGALTIGIGRLYLDGYAAESFGAGADTFDAAFENLRGTDPLPFADQPFRPGLTPPAPDAGRHLVYLDVWRRTVTHLQDPALIEPALGVDTTARTQTVWQVRTLAVGSDVTCATASADIAGWSALTRPSAARLTTRNVSAPDPEDPCLLPPGAAYRGLENRTYRVEIHDQDPDGRWRFKWSRDNATVATAVTTVETLSRLVVAEVARDDVKRLEPGDWVEVLDDRLELEAIPAPLRRVLSVDDGTGLVELETALPGATFAVAGDGTPARHLRVIKWDQNGEVRASDDTVLADLTDPNGPGVVRVPAPGEAVRIEPGIELAFGLADPGGEMRVGDHWIFTARTATARIEELDAAPPLGIHHHHLRLAVVDADGSAFLAPASDCRPRPPEAAEGCCTEVVAVGEDIQAAIDRLPPAGGCVCLKAGEHRIEASLRIARDRVKLHGESPGVVLRGPPDAPILLVAPNGEFERVVSIRLASLDFRADGRLDGIAPRPNTPYDGLLVLERVRDVEVVDCGFDATVTSATAGVVVADALATAVRRCRFGRVGYAILTVAGGHELVFADNLVDATGLVEAGGAGVGIVVTEADGDVAIERNTLRGVGYGIVVNDEPGGPAPFSAARGVRIEANRIALARFRDPQNAAATLALGIDVAADAAHVAANEVALAAPRHIGIRTTGSGARILANAIESGLDSAEATGVVGVQIGVADLDSGALTHEVAVHGNRLGGAMQGIVVVDAAVVDVAHNHVSAGIEAEPGAVTVGIALLRSERCRVADNTVTGGGFAVASYRGAHNRLLDNDFERTGAGITLAAEVAPVLAGNRLEGVARWGALAMVVLGRFACRDNRLIRCGVAADPAAALAAWLVIGEWQVVGNEIVDTGIAASADDDAPRAYGISGDLVLEASLGHNLVTYGDLGRRNPAAEDRAVRLRGYLEASYATAAMDLPAVGFEAIVTGNRFVGTGRSALVEFREQTLTDTLRARFESITFNDNVCRHVVAADADDGAATVRFAAGVAIVMGNRIKASRPLPFSFDFGGATGTYLGNVASGDAGGFIDFPTPSSDYNRQI
jgi:nitrous oxidase accessory protein NosD